MADWIKNFMGAPKRPNGDYNSSHMPDLQPNKIQKIGWPGGVFNNQDALLSSMQNAEKKMPLMSKNLMSNQTNNQDYIHIPRIIIPLTIPCVESEGLTELVKSITSGDVLFNLRYNSQIMKAGLGSRLVRKDGGDSVFSINLATLNYLLIGLQRYLHKFHEACMTNNKEEFENQLNSKQNRYRDARRNAVPVDRKELNDEKYFLWMNLVTNDDFKNMLHSKYWDTWVEFEGLDKEKASLKVLKKYWQKYTCSIMWDFINTYAKLAGVFVGSDNQGGNHYGQSNPCSFAPTDFVGVLQAAGKNRKVRNLWCTCDHGTSGGDLLGFRFALCTKKQNLFYRLSSNINTQKEAHVPSDEHDYCLLVPAKKNSNLGIESEHIEWIDSNFLQFGICNQMSKASAFSSNNIVSMACDATFSTMPGPLEILLRFDFSKISSFCYANMPKLAPFVGKLHGTPRSTTGDSGQSENGNPNTDGFKTRMEYGEGSGHGKFADSYPSELGPKSTMASNTDPTIDHAAIQDMTDNAAVQEASAEIGEDLLSDPALFDPGTKKSRRKRVLDVESV